MNNVRIGTVPYLNARPLVSLLVHCPRPGVEVLEAVPSALAGMLHRREVDCALVSSVIALENPDVAVLSAGAVTSDGPVKSIRLMSRVPPAHIRSLALDASSRTGIVLGQVLLARQYGVRPRVVSSAPDIPRMLEAADAGLIIGDPALQASESLERGDLPMVAYDIDLGSLWRSVTGLPFVYALWTAQPDCDAAALEEILGEAVRWGTMHLDEIASEEAPRAGIPEAACRSYLRENVRYQLGPAQWAGLKRFGDWATELGLLSQYESRGDVAAR